MGHTTFKHMFQSVLLCNDNGGGGGGHAPNCGRYVPLQSENGGGALEQVKHENSGSGVGLSVKFGGIYLHGADL